MRAVWPALAAALVLASPAASAQNKPSDHPEVVRLTLKGAHVSKTEDLLENVATTPSHCNSVLLTPICWVTKSKYFYSREYLDHAELTRDVLRLRVYYWKRGYRDTQVDTTVVSQGQNKVAVTFNISEGPPTLVSSVTVDQGQPAILTDRDLATRVVIGKNSPLNLIRLDSSRALLTQTLWERGYADAVVDTVVVLDSASRTAAITINIDPKWRTTINDIVVTGNKGVATSTIRKSLSLKIGDIFRRSDLLRSQRALYESNLFRRAAIEPRPPIDPFTPDSAKVIVVTVTEAPPQDARISAGFNTVDFFQVEGRYTNYNWRGGARNLDVQASVGNLLQSSLNGRGIFRNVDNLPGSNSSSFTAPTYSTSIDVRQPWFGSPQNEIALGLFAHRHSSPGIYVDRGYGTSATFTRQLADRAPASLNYRFEISRVEAGDVYFCINYGVCDVGTLDALRKNQRLSPLSLSATIDKTNDPFSPNRGYRANFGAEHASAFTLSDFRYNRATGEAALFKQIRKRGALGAHARVGWVNALGSTSQAVGVTGSLGQEILHPRKRFYAGGSHSVRGFGENQLGPRVLTIPAQNLRTHDSSAACLADVVQCNPNAAKLETRDFQPQPLGGNFVAEGSVEARFPVWASIVGAVFVDGGLVTQRTNPDLPRRRAAITPGFGVRYSSPVGPIRADIGFNPGTVESLPVVTEKVVNGQTTLVTLASHRIYSPGKGLLNRMVLHLSIGEAF